METNERVNDTYHNLQMPRVEYETFTVGDYSECSREMIYTATVL